MTEDEDPDAGRDFATLVQGAEIPIWPNLKEVPIDERRRAWCLATSLESVPLAGKPVEAARQACEVAAVFDQFIREGQAAAKLKVVKGSES